MNPQYRPSRTGSSLLVGILLVTLGLAAAFAWQVQSSVRSHQQTATRALRDYSAFAAFQFARQAKGNIHGVVVQETWKTEAVPHTDTGRLPHPSILTTSAATREKMKQKCKSCARLDSVRLHYRLDLRDGSLVTTGPAMHPELLLMLKDTLARAATQEGESYMLYGAIFTRVDGTPHVIGYQLRRGPDGMPMYAYGFDAHPAAIRTAFSSIIDNVPMLPPTLTGNLPNDSLLGIVVLDDAKNEVFRSTRDYSHDFAAADTTFSVVGHLQVNVAVRPDAAETLLIGGLPRSRLPVLLALLTLATLLVGAAIFQLRRENELARLRDDFVSGVSHELRTPLAQIRMFAETLRLGRVRSDGERERSLEIIDQEARRLTHLVENVLLFSRAERHATRITLEAVCIDEVVADVVETFTPLARARQVELATDLQQSVTACADRDAVRQMLLNLLDNAVKYGPAGQTITLGVAVASQDRARLWVDDEGAGVPAPQRTRIFEPYYRLERDANSAVAGSGIGLSVVGELAVKQSGRAWVTDAPGGGARFIIELPLHASHTTARQRVEPAEPAAATA